MSKKISTIISVTFCLLLSTIFANAQSTENSYRANNKGVSLLEQFKSDEAEKEFLKALELNPKLKLARINLAIALFNEKKLEEAKINIGKYLQTEPDSPQSFYILGLIARSENNSDEALANFRKVLAIDPKDVGTNVNLGQILSQKRDYTEAIKVLQVAYDVEPFNLTAIYNLATALQRNNEREKAAELLKKFQILRDTEAGVNIGLNYLEQGRYAEAIASNGSETDLVDKREPKIKFTNATEKFLGKNASLKKIKTSDLLDFDDNGSIDLVISEQNSISLYTNQKGKFIQVKNTGDLSKKLTNSPVAVIAGDYDNDLKKDILVMGTAGFTLFHNNGNGNFSDVTNSAKLDSVNQSIELETVAFVDFDHDGDIDIFASGSLNLLFRNNGNGTFTDIGIEAKISDKINGNAVVPTDFNNRRDVDLLVAGSKKTYLYSNQRNDTFKDVSTEMGLDVGGNCVAAGDVNKDGFTDYFIGGNLGKSNLFLSNLGGKYSKQEISDEKISAFSAQFLDFDNDGLLDLVTSNPSSTIVWRNLGKTWKKFTLIKGGGRLASGDIDNDGDIDLIYSSNNNPIKIFRNDGGNTNNSETLNLQGRVSNKSGIGAKIVMRSGSLSQQLERYSASPMPAPSQIHFGLGKREKSDSIRILWSSGIVQSETDFAVKSRQISIQEVDRKPASCPYLYTWNGEKFEFITDFLGGGEMGGWAGKGVYNFPDSDEFVRIAPDKLKPKNGFYEIRVTNELEEVMYLDKVKLVAVEHEKGTEIYPNEGLGQSEKSTESIVTVPNGHKPLSAINSNGQNILPKISKLDRVFYDDFKSQEIRGYADTHELTMNLDDRKGYNGRTILLLTGWTDYAFSSDNVRASQSGKSLYFPYLQVKNKQGEWQTVIDSIGIPIGRPQTLSVDLTGKFLTDSREVRIVTNFRTYWDKIAVDTSELSQNINTFEIEPEIAELREHGYGKESKINEMIVPDYNIVFFNSPWKEFVGRFTKFGDVKPLLSSIDDIFVIAKAGDEFVLKFKELPKLPENREYTFLLFADGYSKEMDINSGSPESVLPLPFKGMTKYPYDSSEKYPMTDEKRKIYDETLTRFSRGGIARF